MQCLNLWNKYVYWASLGHSQLGKGHLSWENASIILACRVACEVFCRLMADVGEPNPL